jgi:hypothetical protein
MSPSSFLIRLGRHNSHQGIKKKEKNSYLIRGCSFNQFLTWDLKINLVFGKKNDQTNASI